MRRALLAFVLVTIVTGSSKAAVNVSGLADIVFRNSDDNDLTNVTFRGYSNFHTQRLRLFFDAPLSQNNALFAQILIDDNNFQLYGAYARFSHVATKYLNLQIGLIPNPVGAWGPRTYSNKNPLIGVPLCYVHHSALTPSGKTHVRTVDDLLEAREYHTNYGLPVVYDACWNTGAELFGSVGKLDYSIGAVTGALSAPTQEQKKDVPQFTTHLVYYFSPGIIVGGSAFYGPYLTEVSYADSLPVGKKYGDFMNGGVGYELYLAHHHLEFFSESYYTWWEHPYVPKLKVVAGYFEGKYKFLPGWYVAARYDYFQPGKLTSSEGEREPWDFPVRRYEVGIGYAPTRETLVKLVTQQNHFLDTEEYDDVDLDSELYALQLSVSF